MATVDIETNLRRLALFADLPAVELEALAATLRAAEFGAGDTVLRQGAPGSFLYVILDGDAIVVADGEEKRLLSRGSFFGEISILLGEPVSADVVAQTPLSCLTVPAAELETLLLGLPRLMYRMLQTEARRVRSAGGTRA